MRCDCKPYWSKAAKPGTREAGEGVRAFIPPLKAGGLYALFRNVNRCRHQRRPCFIRIILLAPMHPRFQVDTRRQPQSQYSGAAP